LAPESFERQNVPHIAWLGLAQLAASEFQLVVHQEDNARRSHMLFEKPCHPERSEGPAFFSAHETAGPSFRSG
jgi:hypothetical protein